MLVQDLRGLFARGPQDPGPSGLKLEPTNLCNANCVFCGYQFQERPHVELPVPRARDLIDAAKRAGVTHLELTPIVGDPLAYRQLEDIILYATANPPPIRVALTTNGILLTPKRYFSLVNAGLHGITVSMSYPDEEEYRRLYRSSKLRTLVANLEGILDVYRPGECEVNLSVRSPRRDALDHPLFRRARARGWKLLWNTFFDNWSGLVTKMSEAEGLWIRPLRPKRLPCTQLTGGPHVLSDGRATACGCRDLDGRSELVIGDSVEVDFLGAWRDGHVAKLRDRFRTGQVPQICVDCGHYDPIYGGELLRLRLLQLLADLRAWLRPGAR